MADGLLGRKVGALALHHARRIGEHVRQKKDDRDHAEYDEHGIDESPDSKGKHRLANRRSINRVLPQENSLTSLSFASGMVEIIEGGVKVEELEPFFQGWTWMPTTEARFALIENSDLIVAARNDSKLVGIATVLTDGAFFAYLSYLEVLPEVQGQGIAKRLMERVIEKVGGQYDLATITDKEIVPFYGRLGFTDNVSGVHIRFLPKKNANERSS
jgi:GNAT superfamily N-acetyltransferase